MSVAFPYNTRIARTYALADLHDLQWGLKAYQCYHDTLDQIATLYHEPISSVVGAFAALSPNNDYIGNLRSLVSVLEVRANFLPGPPIVSTYKACLDRAQRCLNGAPFLSFTKGLKTRAFYLCIMDPSNDRDVVVDGHMVSIVEGKPVRMSEANLNPKKYAEIARAVTAVARSYEVLPHQVQATCWFAWKRMHRLRFVQQLSFAQIGDPWSLNIDIGSIKPFTRNG